MLAKARTFIQEVRGELVHRVTWPSYEELRSSTIVVIVVSLIFASFIGVLDWFLSLIVQWAL